MTEQEQGITVSKTLLNQFGLLELQGETLEFLRERGAFPPFKEHPAYLRRQAALTELARALASLINRKQNDYYLDQLRRYHAISPVNTEPRRPSLPNIEMPHSLTYSVESPTVFDVDPNLISPTVEMPDLIFPIKPATVFEIDEPDPDEVPPSLQEANELARQGDPEDAAEIAREI